MDVTNSARQKRHRQLVKHRKDKESKKKKKMRDAEKERYVL
jgi:hypothetical protein